jgi:hypothetical protein
VLLARGWVGAAVGAWKGDETVMGGRIASCVNGSSGWIKTCAAINSRGSRLLLSLGSETGKRPKSMFYLNTGVGIGAVLGLNDAPLAIGALQRAKGGF